MWADAQRDGRPAECRSWNSLPQHVIEAPSVNSFKKRLDDYYQDMGLLYIYEYEYDGLY